MKEIKQIPKEVEKIKCILHWCGDDWCNCHHFTINGYATKNGDEYPSWVKDGELYSYIQLHESTWISGHEFDDFYKEDYNNLKNEILEVCNILGIKNNLHTINEVTSLYDWEFEDKIINV